MIAAEPIPELKLTPGMAGSRLTPEEFDELIDGVLVVSQEQSPNAGKPRTIAARRSAAVTSAGASRRCGQSASGHCLRRSCRRPPRREFR